MRAMTPTRRGLIAGAAMIFGGVAGMSKLRAQAEQHGGMPDATRTTLHQDVVLNASPRRLYATLLDAKLFAAFSGAPAEIEPKAGGAFTLFGGLIVGRTVELIPGQRIVQAWRPTHWAAGVYSSVRFELKPQGAGTAVALDHTGFPPGEFDDLSAGWKSFYWDRLAKFLG
jgi:activator of HSP90 ATPase